MLYFFLLSRLPRRDDGLACAIHEKDSITLLFKKIIPLHLAAVDQRQDEPISDRRTEFLHHVERETGTAWPVGMEKSDRGIQPNAFQCGFHIMAEKRIDEGQEGVYTVARRASAATCEAEGFLVADDHLIKDREVYLPSKPLVTTSFFYRSGLHRFCAQPGQLAGGGSQCLLIPGHRRFTRGAKQHDATVGD